MLSHIRKVLEKAVTRELEQAIETDRMYFGFKRNIKTVQSALDIAAIVEEQSEKLVEVIDLEKAYDRVVC